MFFLLLSGLSFSGELNLIKKVNEYRVRKENININIYFEEQVEKDNFYNENQILNYFSYYSNMHFLLANENERKKENLDCSSDNLNIYVVSKEFLNNRSKINSWISGDYNEESEGVNLVGLFKYERGVNNIYLQKTTDNRGLYFAHEIAHFWYRKRCNDLYDYDLNESLAMDFENNLVRLDLVGELKWVMKKI